MLACVTGDLFPDHFIVHKSTGYHQQDNQDGKKHTLKLVLSLKQMKR